MPSRILFLCVKKVDKTSILFEIQNGTLASLDSVDFGDSRGGVALLEKGLRVHIAGLLLPGRTW